MDIIINSLEQSVLFFPLVLGVYMGYTILRAMDLTIEGSFVLGAGVYARLMTLNIGFGVSVLAALAAGGLAGAGVSSIQRSGKINPLVAGIIGLFILYAVNIKIMGRPNIGLESVIDDPYFIIAILVSILTLWFGILIASRIGLVLRALGNNPCLLWALAKNVERYRLLGFVLSNALAALCGSLTAEVNGYADLGMGLGMTLTGISTVMIGQKIQHFLFKNNKFNIVVEIISCFFGVFVYFLTMNVLLSQGLDPIHLKFVLGFLMIILLRETQRG